MTATIIHLLGGNPLLSSATRLKRSTIDRFRKRRVTLLKEMNGGGVENWLIENIGTLPNDLSTNRAKSIYRDLRKRQNGQSAKPSCWRIACAVIADGAILTLGKRSDFSMPRQAAVCPQR